LVATACGSVDDVTPATSGGPKDDFEPSTAHDAGGISGARRLGPGGAADKRLPIEHGQRIRYEGALKSLREVCTGPEIKGIFVDGECICPSTSATFNYYPRPPHVGYRCSERVASEQFVNFDELSRSGTASSVESAWRGPLGLRIGQGSDAERTATARAVAAAAGRQAG
jgi:hypothetical protein